MLQHINGYTMQQQKVTQPTKTIVKKKPLHLYEVYSFHLFIYILFNNVFSVNKTCIPSIGC
jgi:hypothetical protein